MTTIEVRSGDEVLTSNAGLALLGQLLRRSRLADHVAPLDGAGRSDRTSAGDVVQSLCGLISLGRLDYERIEQFRSDDFFAQSLGIDSVPSAPTLRQRTQVLCGATTGDETPAELSMCDARCERMETAVRDSLVRLLRSGNCEPTALTLSKGGAMVPVDLDTTVMPEAYGAKEGVGWTYQKVLGYTPMFAYIGREGFALDAELRPGTQHSQKGTPEFIRRARGMAERIQKSKQRRLWRLDGGFDAAETVEAIEECPEDGYIVAHNRRKESLEMWWEIAKENGVKSTPRLGKTVWIGETQRPCGSAGLRRCIFRFIERTSDHEGQRFIDPQLEVRMFWTNLDESPDEIISLYADHGTSEQFHAEYKTDLGMEQFPSGDYRVNRVLALLGALVFNALRELGLESLRTDGVPLAELAPVAPGIKRRRIRSVMDDFIRIAGRIVRTGRRLILSLGRPTAWVPTWLRLHRVVSHLAQT